MSMEMILFTLAFIIFLLLVLVLYQQWAFRTGIRRELREIHRNLHEIITRDSNEPVLVFTENKELKELAAQINRLLENYLKIKADYRRSRMASKRMLSNISHDIKTPMTVILGYLELMQENGEASPEMLAKTAQKAKDMMTFINQFFTLSKIEAGDMEPELVKLDICECCRESVLNYYELLTKDNFQVEIRIPEYPVYIQGNKEALQRIFSNLISNVIRYGADGKYLGVFLKEEERNVRIEFVDKGKGIEKAFADHVFDRLFTMEDSGRAGIRGNGLGLSIAKGLVQQLGGELTLESTPYVRTAFTIRFKKL